MMDTYKSRYTGEQIDSYLDDVTTLKEQQTEQRLTILEKWMKAENYTSISVSTTGTMAKVLFGDFVENQIISWSMNKAAKKIEIILPNGNTIDVSELETVDLSGEGTSYYTDTNKYQITSSLTWRIIATEEDGKDIGELDANGNPVITYNTDNKPTSIAIQYAVFWGVGTQTDEFGTTFFKNLSSGNATSKSTTLTFGSISGEYVYYIVPKVLCSAEPKFDINGDGFIDNFEKMPNITLTFNGESIVYYIYRSANLLTSEGSFKVVVI